jgi:cytochrome c-type biogenesis protein
VTESISYPAALFAGLLSFFSPCILPLLPAYFTFITGLSIEELTATSGRAARQRIIMATLAFVSGFSIVFVVFGASATLAGRLLFEYSDGLRIAGGLVVILLGIHLTGWVRLPLLDIEKRIHLHRKPVRLLGVVVVGMAFGAGWSPCIGPLLGSILVLAAGQETVVQGIALLSVYSLGLGLPFLVLSAAVHFLLGFLNRARKALQYVNRVAGVLLIVIGVALVANRLNLLMGI